MRLYEAQKESFLYGLSFNPRLKEGEGQKNWLRNELANHGQGIEEISKETQPKPVWCPGEVRSVLQSLVVGDRCDIFPLPGAWLPF